VKIYFDLCAIQRPLDTADQIRIILESEAVLGLFSFCESGRAELISSEALLYEAEQSTLPIRREHSYAVLEKSKDMIFITEKDKSRASEFLVFGIKPLDALHLALAESGKADYFCTCDDTILKKSKQIMDLKVKVLSPVDLVQEIEK
jgi:predicted nucleic acid-binding protein